MRNALRNTITTLLFLMFVATAATTVTPVYAAETGSSQYGPFNTRVEPGGKSLQKTVNPDERIKSSEPVPQRKHEHVKGRLMIKLSPVGTSSTTKTTAKTVVTSDEDVLEQVRATRGFKGMKKHFKQAKSLKKAGEMITGRDGKMVKKPDLTRWYRIDVDENEDVLQKIEELKKIPGVEIVEPDYIRKPSVLPSSSTDPLFGQQWHLAATKIPEAWAHLQAQGLPPGGTRDVVVAVIDTGVDLNHPDLAASLWTSQDGSHGRDVIADNNNPQDDHGHGTHVAGIIAAQANNAAGGVGIAYNVQIMAIKAAQYSGNLSSSDIAEGINFAVANGADVINMSFGGYGKSRVEEDALAVAFVQAVLVAAAGNDGLTNDFACDPFKAKVMYPAGYNWVLGVMASNPDGTLASFSNSDCIPNDRDEYEIMAPGVGIMSTLPNNQYAAWSGTSMATPVVAGIAALVRTKFPDKDTYTSRFIMGQLAATGAMQQIGSVNLSYHVPDAYAALTTLPKPKLSYLEHWLFDTTTLSAKNNNNGRVDVGETIDLAVNIRNQWGKADNVTGKLEAVAGVVGPDPYVTMITDTVNYGAVGSFSADDNGLTRDTAGAITGVANPFRFSVSPTTPNGHIIPFKVTITARNGFDAADSTIYTTVSNFNLTVTNGTELPRTITQNMVLTKDTFWIVPDATLIEAGVTVTINEGTKIQFYSSEAKKPYALDPLASLTVKGTLNIAGTTDAPVELLLAPNYNGRVISIQKQEQGVINFEYARIENPSLIVNNIVHSEFVGTGNFSFVEKVNSTDINFFDMQYVSADKISKSRFKSLGYDGFSNNNPGMRINNDDFIVKTLIEESLFDRNIMSAIWRDSSPSFKSNTVLNSSRYSYMLANTWQKSNFFFNSKVNCDLQNAQFSNNAFLERYINPDRNRWTVFSYYSFQYDGSGSPFCLQNNYWGTTSTTILDTMIWDYNDDFSLGKITYQPILTTAPETAYPFVVNVAISNSAGQPLTSTGAGAVTFTVTFNRDMDQTFQPQVSFGPAEPYTDYTVKGTWQDARTWVGNFSISPLTGDGYQIIRVAGARAASDHWLVTGDDSGRFQFEIITSGTESMNLQANGGQGSIDLSWSQDDFDLLAGYNVYRSTTSGGTFTRINSTIIPPQTKTYKDTDITFGQPYYYKFTVGKTDMAESSFSNVATASALDNVPPVITHTSITTANPGLTLPLSAQVTDNVAVTGVTLYSRAIGVSTYSSKTMIKTTGNTYASNIAGSLMIAPGVEYYITATDGINTANSGSSGTPYQVVISVPVITYTVTPSAGSNGSISPATAQTVNSGATTNFTVTPASGYQIASVSGCGGSLSGSTYTTGAISAACTVTASFSATATVPGAPTNVTATVGSGQATVSFTAPANNGGSTITGYTVTSAPGTITASGTASPITISGLTNGTAYSFTVKAINSVGTGQASSASNSVTPVSPGTPLPSLDLGTASGSPGKQVTVPITLTNITGVQIATARLDIGYDTTLFSNPTVTLGAAGTGAGKTLTSSSPAAGVFRVALYDLNNTVIANGVVANVTFTIAATAATGTSAQLTNAPSASNPSGNDVGVTGQNGTLNFVALSGDCNGDGNVTPSEFTSAINVFMGKAAGTACVSFYSTVSVTPSYFTKVINAFMGR